MRARARACACSARRRQARLSVARLPTRLPRSPLLTALPPPSVSPLPLPSPLSAPSTCSSPPPFPLLLGLFSPYLSPTPALGFLPHSPSASPPPLNPPLPFPPPWSTSGMGTATGFSMSSGGKCATRRWVCRPSPTRRTAFAAASVCAKKIHSFRQQKSNTLSDNKKEYFPRHTRRGTHRIRSHTAPVQDCGDVAFMVTLSYALTIFWAIDILLNFNTGHSSDHSWEPFRTPIGFVFSPTSD